MSPILVRPVREQLEHDRIIRLLQAKYKRKFEVGVNPGSERTAPVGTPPTACFPDLVLYSPDHRRVLGVVEVETTESVNMLEAMSQWVQFGKLQVPFFLYVPVNMVDVARRLCQDHDLPVELLSFSGFGDQIRYAPAYKAANFVEVPVKSAATAMAPVKAPAAPKPAAPAKAAPPPAKPAVATKAAAPASTAARPAAKAAARTTGKSNQAAAKPAARPARSTSAASARRPAGGRASKAAPARPRPKAAKAAPARKAQKRK